MAQMQNHGFWPKKPPKFFGGGWQLSTICGRPPPLRGNQKPISNSKKKNSQSSPGLGWTHLSQWSQSSFASKSMDVRPPMRWHVKTSMKMVGRRNWKKLRRTKNANFVNIWNSQKFALEKEKKKHIGFFENYYEFEEQRNSLLISFQCMWTEAKKKNSVKNAEKKHKIAKIFEKSCGNCENCWNIVNTHAHNPWVLFPVLPQSQGRNQTAY